MLASGADAAAAAPETLQGVVVARIDALPSEEKELLQLAAVLGKVFWTDALSSLSDADSWRLEEMLHALERKEFVRREHRSAVAGSKQFVFVHALVRDGAYDQMSRAVRADVHERVADWIETLPADRADDRSEILAHHLLEAIEYSRAAGLDDAPLVPRAARALRESGDRALAHRRSQRGARFLHAGTRVGSLRRGRPLLLLAIGLALATGDFTDAGADELERAAAALRAPIQRQPPRRRSRAASSSGSRRPGGGVRLLRSGESARRRRCALTPEKLYVVAQTGRFLALAGRHDEAGELVEQSVSMAEELGDDGLLGDALNNRASVYACARRSSLAGGLGAKRGACAQDQFLPREPCVHQPGIEFRGHRRRPRPGRSRNARGPRRRAEAGPPADINPLVPRQPCGRDLSDGQVGRGARASRSGDRE